MRGCVSARRPAAIARYTEAVTPFQPLVSDFEAVPGTEIVSAFFLPTPSRRNSLGKRTWRKSLDVGAPSGTDGCPSPRYAIGGLVV